MKNNNEIKKENLLHIINSFEDFLGKYPVFFLDLNMLKNIKKDK